MTEKEKIIVSAYTGYLMYFVKIAHQYIEQKLGRPVYTHELSSLNVQNEIMNKVRDDFLSLCDPEMPGLLS